MKVYKQMTEVSDELKSEDILFGTLGLLLLKQEKLQYPLSLC
jgi:hypothetical protein